MTKRKAALAYHSTISWIGYVVVEFGYFVLSLNKREKANMTDAIGHRIINVGIVIEAPNWIEPYL